MISRRTAIFAALVLTPLKAFARTCRDAVIADEGPFYPAGPIPETEDLLHPGATVPGRVLHLLGRVIDEQCAGVSGATVEIWQCDAGGQYDHPRAPKTKALEAGFRYFGKTKTRAGGSFRFRTIRPAPYRVFGLLRAPHIHIRVKSAAAPTLTTEIYFAGTEDEKIRQQDGVFRSRGARRNELVVELTPFAAERDALVCQVDLMI